VNQPHLKKGKRRQVTTQIPVSLYLILEGICEDMNVSMSMLVCDILEVFQGFKNARMMQFLKLEAVKYGKAPHVDDVTLKIAMEASLDIVCRKMTGTDMPFDMDELAEAVVILSDLKAKKEAKKNEQR